MIFGLSLNLPTLWHISGETRVPPDMPVPGKRPFPRRVGGSGWRWAGCWVRKGSFWWPCEGGRGGHLLHTFYLFLVWNGRVSGAVNLTHFLNLYPSQVGLTAGENHIFWALNRLSTVRKKEKQWALQPCLPAVPSFLTLPLARLSAWPLLTCGAFNKEREGSNFILSVWVIHVLKGDKNVIRKFSCQMCGKRNQFINAVKPMCEIGIKGEVRSHPRAYCGRMCCKTKGSCPQKGDKCCCCDHKHWQQTNKTFSSAQMDFKVLGWEMLSLKEQTLIMSHRTAAWNL